MLIFFSIYFFFNFFIFPLLPGREKIRYHSITACIIQHWRALPVATFANTIIRSQRRNLICVCPTGLHPPCCNYCLFLLCILIWNWASGKEDHVSRTKQMFIWMHGVLSAFIMLYKGYTYMFHCCKSVYSLKAFAQEQVAMLRSVGSSRSPLAWQH